LGCRLAVSCQKEGAKVRRRDLRFGRSFVGTKDKIFEMTLKFKKVV
jgi:hypothetical protein